MEDQTVVGLAAALGGCFVSACVVIPGILGWIGPRWLFLVEGWVVLLVYPHLEVGTKYELGAVEALWQEVSGRSPLELLGASPLDQFGCSFAPQKIAELAAGD